jgi:hypothetical protein
MQLNIVDSRCFDPIIGSTDKVLQTTNTLCRLSQLNDSLAHVKTMRSKGLKEIQDIGEKAKEQLLYNDLDEVKMTMKTALSSIKTGVRENKDISKIYATHIEAATTVNELNKCIRHLLKDSSSLLTFSLEKSDKGQNGPTYIVSYARPSKKYSKPPHREYVIKWTNGNEICSWRLYDIFSQNLPLQPFIVSKVATLDFDKQLHEMGDQTRSILEKQTAIDLKQSLISVVNKSKNPNDTLIMLIEKISGSNLIDFVRVKYPLLKPEEKQNLFEKMGQLAMLDFLLGNTDRLIQTSYNMATKQYQCENQTANLGNLMVDWFPNEGKFPYLYAIDNGIKPQLITDDAEKIAYKQFVHNYFVDSQMIGSLADLIADSMKKSCVEHAELSTTLDITLAQKLKEFEPLMNDLKDPGFLIKSLEKGLNEMSIALKEWLPSFWGNYQALKIKIYLKENYSMLLDAVSERIEILNQRKT